MNHASGSDTLKRSAVAGTAEFVSMYAKPMLQPLDATTASALCCEIRSETFIVRTPLCGVVEFCRFIEPCSVTVGPVTISG